MIDESTVRDKVREAIQTGKLPHRRPDRTDGGRGTEVACAACGDLVRRDQMEIRMELIGYASPYQTSLTAALERLWATGEVSRYNVHTRCYIAWEFVLAAGDFPRRA
jgi:hypothetical protein